MNNMKEAACYFQKGDTPVRTTTTTDSELVWDFPLSLVQTVSQAGFSVGESEEELV